MTLIIGYKDFNGDGKVCIGCDSAGSDNVQTRPNLSEKLWWSGSTLIGVSGSYRVGQVMRYLFDPPIHENHVSTSEYLFGSWVPALVETMEKAGCVQVENGVKSMGAAAFLVGYRNRLFTLQNNFSMIEEADGIHTIGSGFMAGLAAMKALSQKNSKKKILKALEIVGEIMPGSVGGPYYVEEMT